MVTVKVRRPLHSTRYGALHDGDVVAVTRSTARAWIAGGLADEVATKQAQEHRNKMAPAPRHNDPPPSRRKQAPRRRTRSK